MHVKVVDVTKRGPLMVKAHATVVQLAPLSVSKRVSSVVIIVGG